MIDVNIDDIASIIAENMNNYTDAVTEEIKKAVDIVSKETNEEIKAHITFKQPTGKYVKSFRIKTIYEDRFNKKNVWHVTNSEYRLTHLLEKGHALRNGGRAKAFPHIKYGEEFAEKRLEELGKEAVNSANGR